MASMDQRNLKKKQDKTVSPLTPDAAITLLNESDDDISEIEFPIRGQRKSALSLEDLAKCLNFANSHGHCSEEQAIKVLVDEQFNLLRGIEDALCDKFDKTRYPIL